MGHDVPTPAQRRSPFGCSNVPCLYPLPVADESASRLGLRTGFVVLWILFSYSGCSQPSQWRSDPWELLGSIASRIRKSNKGLD